MDEHTLYVNRVTLVGIVSSDEVKSSSTGVARASFQVETKQFYEVESQTRSATEWHNIIAWGKIAEGCSKYIKKGDHVLVVGAIKTSKYTSKNNEQKKITQIVASKIGPLGEKAELANEPTSATYEPAEMNLPF